MEHVSCSMGLPVSDLPMDMPSHISDNSNSHGFSGPSEQMGVVDPMSLNPMFSTSAISSTGVPNYEISGEDAGFNSIWMSADLVNEDPVILSSISGHDKPLPVKRKADMGFNSYKFVSEQQIFPDKVYSGIGPGDLPVVMQHPPAQKTVIVSPSLGFTRSNLPSTVSKKIVSENATAGKFSVQRGQPVKKQFSQNKSFSKTKQESSESVRSKMRESLAAALALTLTNSDKPLDTKKYQGHATEATKVAVGSSEPVDSTEKNENTTSEAREGLSTMERPDTVSADGSHVLPAEFHSPYSNLNGGGTFHEFQYTSMLVDEDPQFSDSFFVKDDLLQGNGLSWALDFDVQMTDGKEAQNNDALNSAIGDATEQQEAYTIEILKPENIAFEIEDELFRLFSGVNKKYKEKGRSLLFNLKDRNNPELRERVLSGEISPERLCAMSAEELASKELSEWRTAKAEELAQMKVLPEVDISRLVRKTHKGDYQLELERDDNVVADVSVGSSILTQTQPKKDVKNDSPSMTSLKTGDGSDNVSENQDNLSSLVIPADGADLMQRVMGEELKNPTILPPIVSLDEFMESLNSEPPFEKLSSDADQSTPKSHERLNSFSKSSRASSKDVASKDSDGARLHEETNTNTRKRESPNQNGSNISVDDVKYAWEGALQFNNSSSVIVHGLYQSGEKTSTKQWPSSLDIKGRVRLGAFEKFVQDLPVSRTRAVMVLKLELKDKASKTQLTSLCEAIASYTAEERLGYAEPMTGVEIYLCPATARVADMVKYFIPKETVDSIEDGLIGVVVWRRAAKGSKQISPKSPSLHKHSSSKKHASSIHSRPQDSPKVKNSSAAMASNNVKRSKPEPEIEDDEIPPGFGPSPGNVGNVAAIAKHDDDLPEFNFSGQMNPPLPRIPAGDQPVRHSVDKVRELIQKYGQSDSTSSSNVTSRMSSIDDRRFRSGFEPWNDDEDDIPEWQPQAPPHLQLHQQSSVVAPIPIPIPQNPAAAEQFPSGRWPQKLRPPPQHGARWRHY